MTQSHMACIQRTCPDCGASNRVVTPEVRPSWTINCSNCGARLVERRGFHPRLVEPVGLDLVEPAGRNLDGAPGAI